MRHFLYSAQMQDGRQVCIAPVSLDTFEANAAYPLGDDTGYFIYEYDDAQSTGLEILGKAVSYEAAIRIAEIFAESRNQSVVQAIGQEPSTQSLSPVSRPCPFAL